MRGTKTLRERIERRIASRRDSAFLAREFRDLGGERQVLRELSRLVAEGRLVRLGYGVYGRAVISGLSGKPQRPAHAGAPRPLEALPGGRRAHPEAGGDLAFGHAGGRQPQHVANLAHG